MPPRPHERLSTDALVALAEQKARDPEALAVIADELKHRSGKRAVQLAADIAQGTFPGPPHLRRAPTPPAAPVTLATQPALVPGASGVHLKEWVQESFKDSHEWAEVRRVASLLHAHLNTPDALRKLDAANQPGRGSAEVQRVLSEYAQSLGFESEKEGLFVDTELALRPDYFLRIGATGVLLEVERGKTTMNNMHLLDLWKCHICEHAHYLFLMVPLALRQNAHGQPRREFESVARHLASFFQRRNYTNVRGLCLFGY